MLPISKTITQAPAQLLILFATLALFLITNAIFGGNNSLNFIPILIAILIVIEILVFVAIEVKEGTKKHGWKHEIVDTLLALLIAVVIWYGVSFILNTNSPISGVVSCSMLPNLQRGDFILVQGALANAYEIEMTEQELDSLTSDAIIHYEGSNFTIKGSIFSYCIYNQKAELCQFFVDSPEKIIEEKGAFTYKYERCSLSYSDGGNATLPCLSSVTFKNHEYLTNFSHDTIVYASPKDHLYSLIGDIVHRAMFKINVGDETYYLTRGDNNPILDLQVYDYGRDLTNAPVSEEYVRGKVIARIPILGYFKLFISGYLQEDSQCRTQLDFTHIS
ncbi:hypothetical protein KKB44_03770 [Candidatus Micrarchaeota archaeon]|nr:hypothetical protein [Candidatus Micrarchaeota archaeon]